MGDDDNGEEINENIDNYSCKNDSEDEKIGKKKATVLLDT